MRRNHMRKMLKHLSLLAILLLAVIMFGCEGDKGDRGENGTSFGTVTGLVTDTAVPTPHNIAGVTVTPIPAVQGVAPASTDANGNYSLTLPNGNYTLTYSRPGYATQTQTVNIVATQTTTAPTVALVQTAAAVVNVANARFGNQTTATMTATTLVNDPNLVGQPASYTWTDANGNVIGTGPTITVHKPSNTTLIAAVSENAKVRMSVYPPGHDPIADANDFDVPDFETLDRMQVLPITQNAYETAANTQVRVTSQIGTAAPFSNFSTTAIATSPLNTLPFVPNAGIRNVALGQPVALQGNVNTNNTYIWTLGAPTGSTLTTANLTGANTRFPSFVPDVPGQYTVTESGSGTARTMFIYAGTYVGMLTRAPNDNPYGILDTACSNATCHTTGTASFATPYQGSTPTAPVQFFDINPINTVFNIWTGSGHRHIMVKAMMQSPSHYTLNACAKCHSVGWTQYSSAIKAQGFSDVIKAANFTDATWRSKLPNVFAGFDQVLRKSEVQCESCHGPNGDGSAHNRGTTDAIAARMSVSSDMCGLCHGEPLRHGRYQEWRVSGHGDFQTAMGEGISGVSTAAPFGTGPNTSCAGCHTGQAFPLWIQQLQGTGGNTPNPNRNIANRPAPGPQNVTYLSFLRTNNVQPQTCQTCHRVHNPGRSSGLEGALIYLRGDFDAHGAWAGVTPLLPGGFQANGVGMGALCITCHNSRNGGVGAFENATVGLHEDADPNFGALTAYSVPHEACQGDVLMGHNAYFFSSTVVGEDRTFVAIAGQPTFTPVPQTGRRSAHSLIGDSCVACHMLKTPTDPNFGYPPGVEGAGSNHTFAIVTDRTRPATVQINNLCTQCHGGFQGSEMQDSFDASYRQLLVSASNAILRIKYGSTAAIPAGTSLVFIPGRTPAVAVSTAGGAPVMQSLASFLTPAVGTANATVTAGFNRDLAKANWNIALVAPRYVATMLNGSSYDNGTPITTVPSTLTTEVAGDQSRAVHNPSFVFNVMNVTMQRLNAM